MASKERVEDSRLRCRLLGWTNPAHRDRIGEAGGATEELPYRRRSAVSRAVAGDEIGDGLVHIQLAQVEQVHRRSRRRDLGQREPQVLRRSGCRRARGEVGVPNPDANSTRSALVIASDMPGMRCRAIVAPTAATTRSAGASCPVESEVVIVVIVRPF